MEAICFSLHDFDLIVNPFDFTSVYGMVAVVDNTVTVTLKSVGKSS